jgi:hypothetical protein
MYNLFLYIKYIKHCVFKKPLIVRTYSEYSSNDIDSITHFPNMLYILTTQSGQKVVANLNKYKYYSKKKKINNKYAAYVLKWNFLRYETQPSIINCDWKQFKSIYTTFFYPHLISDDEITSRLVANKLAPDQDETIKSIYLIR